MTEDSFRMVIVASVALMTLAFVVQAAMMIAVYQVSTKTHRVVTKFVGDVKPVLADTGTALAAANRLMHESSGDLAGTLDNSENVSVAERETGKRPG
ncbi:MAG TPA: hypothetical protein VMH28_16855 [Candidatus Acidoferrales bacterium]|nr:hypothetical protein [Candidatus Acidoferrales bacterium]